MNGRAAVTLIGAALLAVRNLAAALPLPAAVRADQPAGDRLADPRPPRGMPSPCHGAGALPRTGGGQLPGSQGTARPIATSAAEAPGLVIPFSDGLPAGKRLDIATRHMNRAAESLMGDARDTGSRARGGAMFAEDLAMDRARLDRVCLDIAAMGARARQIARDAAEIHRLILAGDIDGCIALQARLQAERLSDERDRDGR